jgi:hypothetical protein
MFVGEMQSSDSISGRLYNDVGDGVVIGTFNAHLKK